MPIVYTERKNYAIRQQDKPVSYGNAYQPRKIREDY